MIPVLTYHGIHVNGRDYANNDHVALASDLETIHATGWTIRPAAEIVTELRTGALDRLPHRTLALTFDDGSWFDWHDLVHPSFGEQRGFAGILRDFRDRHGVRAQPGLHATSFVIVSPHAREVLDTTCMIGRGWWTDGWWSEARDEGLVGIASHSWDHRHETLPRKLRYNDNADYGQFRSLADPDECDWQVRQSATYLAELLEGAPEPLFAYPFGDVPDILADDYLPRAGPAIGLEAAFSADPEPITARSNPWRLPRFVFGRDWKSPEALEKLLASLGG